MENTVKFSTICNSNIIEQTPLSSSELLDEYYLSDSTPGAPEPIEDP
jgi:hypothetical protein